eukprot:scaffold2518_cov178-Amphora_coffeaeformis.AAC.17
MDGSGGTNLPSNGLELHAIIFASKPSKICMVLHIAHRGSAMGTTDMKLFGVNCPICCCGSLCAGVAE